jgi:signal transduction histidine kinase
MARHSKRPSTGHTILVVDDQDESVISVRRLLEREGHEVVAAGSGAEALRVLQETDVHVVIVDYFMPAMTGAQLVEKIRTFDPYVQIILQTGYAGEKPARQTLAELDIQGYHDKAGDPDRLLLWVDVALKTHRLVQTLRERERLQEELVANCSHEFRTPLNIIRGYAELLKAGDFGTMPESAVEPIQWLLDATGGLTDLVTDFLSYAKVEAGVMQVAREWVSTAQLAQELERVGGLVVDEKAVRFSLDLSAAPGGFVTDPVKLRTVLRNLVVNAAKFTAQGTITLRIALDSDGLRFAVEDTGCGIGADHLAVLFEPFRQGDGSSTRRQGGLGLGLALSRKIVRLIGGELRVTSEPGVGSTFTVVLPHNVVDAPADAAPAGFGRAQQAGAS